MLLEISDEKGNSIVAFHYKCAFELSKGLMFKSKGNALLEFSTSRIFLRSPKIWMLFMRYSLRLYFLDENFKVVDIKDANPLTFNPKTWKLYTTNKKFKYVLEVDFREEFDAKVGEQVKVRAFVRSQ